VLTSAQKVVCRKHGATIRRQDLKVMTTRLKFTPLVFTPVSSLKITLFAIQLKLHVVLQNHQTQARAKEVSLIPAISLLTLTF